MDSVCRDLFLILSLLDPMKVRAGAGLKLILIYVRQSLFTKVKLIKHAFFFPSFYCTRVVRQSEGEVHSDDSEGANAGVLPTAGGRGVHPVQTVRTRNLQDHK